MEYGATIRDFCSKGRPYINRRWEGLAFGPFFSFRVVLVGEREKGSSCVVAFSVRHIVFSFASFRFSSMLVPVEQSQLAIATRRKIRQGEVFAEVAGLC